jgi:cytochrome c oxidase subunit 2
VVTLLVLVTGSAVIGRQIAAERGSDAPHGVMAEPRGAGDALQVRITGNQWWWDVEYQHPRPSMRVRTANELHLPVGRTVRVQLLSTDVIHSFWVPALHGKRDAIPGHDAYIWLRADRAGVFRGQCAEFCGLQHAHMAMTVVAEDGDAFERWISGQRPAAPIPTTALTARGRDIVERGACAMCHQVRGTAAGGRTAPDLTHVATRSTLAAGTLPNTRGHLAGWLSDPQSIKPGARMPIVGLAPDELDAVIAYLETLK